MMTIVGSGLIAFVVIVSGGLLGMVLGRCLPQGYRESDTRTLVQTASGMVSISTALVLGLLVATAKNKFDVSNKQTEELAASIMLMDRNLVAYGPEAKDIVLLLKSYTAAKIADSWPGATEARPASPHMPDWRVLEAIRDGIANLQPQTPVQRVTAAGAASIVADLIKSAWLSTAQEANHVPQPFAIVLIGWLFVLFINIGLFAPHNAMVVCALFICALSLSCAIALVIDLDRPFEGTITVSSAPMEKALLTIGTP